jgi:hypothetical protein
MAVWDIAEPGNGVAGRARVLQAQVREAAADKGLSRQEILELSALAFTLMRLLNEP